MWPGPYGDGGSRKYLLASLDQSLRRMGLDYVDIFYSHRVDPDTPLDETMSALVTAVQQGKALYAGISSYSAARTIEAARLLCRPRRAAAHPPTVVLDAQPVDRARPAAGRARGGGRGLHRLLTAGAGHADRPVPRRRAGRLSGRHRWRLAPRHAHRGADVPRSGLGGRRRQARGQSLAQLALAWALRDPRMTSLVIGASSVAQLDANLAALDEPGVHRRGAAGHRPGRHRRRHQPVGGVQRPIAERHRVVSRRPAVRVGRRPISQGAARAGSTSSAV